MDFWTFLGFAAVLALLAAIEKQLIAIQKDIVETKVKVDYLNSFVFNKNAGLQQLPPPPGATDSTEAHKQTVS